MKTHWPFGGFFLKLSDEKNGTHEYEDYLKECEEEKQLPEEELEFHCSKDPKKMTMQESQEEIGKFLRWNKMTPEERRAELEAQKAATCDTEQAAGDMPCAIEPESAPDTPQGAVLDEAVDAPPGVDSVPGDVSGDAPESAADTVLDNVPDATEGYVPDAIGALKAPEKEAVNATAQGVIAPETTTAETLMQQGAEPTRQAAEPEAEAEGISSLQTPEPAEPQEKCCTVQEAEEVPEVEVVPTEAIVPLGQIGGDAPAEKERWAYASELIGDAFQHWGNGRVLLDMGTGRGKNEFIIKKLVSWLVDEMLKKMAIVGRVLYLCPLNTLHAEMLQRRTEAAIAEVDGEPAEIAMTCDAFYENMLEVRTYQNIETKYRNDPASLKKYLAGFKYIVADECHYFTDFSSYGINTYLSLEVLQKAEADHVVIYMSATGEETYKLLEETSKTPEDRIYKLPQDYQHIKQKYFYSRENLVMMLKSLPEDEKAVIFVSSGEDLLKMKEIFGDTAAYYCSENNPKYGKMFNKLTDCIKDRELQKRYLFTTKAFGIGTEIKDRTVKHLYIDQWKPTDIIQSTGRKRSLDVDDTCTVYFRDYDADWYYGDLKKFKAIVIEELKPAVAYLAGAEAFEVFRNSGTPDSINNKIRKCKIMEFDDAKGEYRVNPLGVRQLKRELELLNEMLETSYKQVFTKYAPVLAEETVPYCFDSVVDWINAHLNQPMLKEEMYESIMALKVFKEYKGRPMGQDALNCKLQIYGVKIISDKMRKRGEYYQKTFWKLTRI
ncbi:DEAD/DEAH box helicase [Faecalibacterium prausnitzii]|uniref:DEAD/DEAH box helicase n=1 Tax=Faecalibacterium prausnitzii TaxID=853 RepID=UPI00290C8E92|nr:DEAD/DEAH box helicase [Faecalibacterium prausnitzii]MDU8670866.1 DEAD/DEAH box helicase family protein [Faecalibacterium prausnitzii]